MELPRRRKIDTRIDMTPMIDTLLQLFVVFMLNMSFLASAVHLDLPKAAPEQKTAAETIVVSLDGSARIFINKEPVSRNELRPRLVALLQGAREQRVTLRADRTLTYEQVLETMVLIQQAGVTQIQLAYEQKAGP